MKISEIEPNSIIDLYLTRNEQTYRIQRPVIAAQDLMVMIDVLTAGFNFSPEDKVDVIYTTKNGASMYKWEDLGTATVPLKSNSELRSVHVLKSNIDAVKSNRRQSVRTTCLTEAEISASTSPINETLTAKQFAALSDDFMDKQQCMILNASKTGIGIACDEDYTVKQGVKVEWKTAWGNTCIIGTINNARKERGTNKYGIEVYYYDSNFIKFVHNEQQKMLTSSHKSVPLRK